MSIPAGAVPYSQINAAIVARLALALNIDPAYIHAVASDSYKVTETENMFAYVRTYGPSPVDSRTGYPLNDQGAGHLCVTVGRRVRIYVYSRSGEDVVGTDDVALGGYNVTQTVETPPSTPGQFIAEEVILNAMHNFVPIVTDTFGNVTPLTLGPLHWLDSESGPPEREPENSEGLIRSHLDFGVLYNLAITSIDPAAVTLPAPVQVPT